MFNPAYILAFFLSVAMVALDHQIYQVWVGNTDQMVTLMGLHALWAVVVGASLSLYVLEGGSLPRPKVVLMGLIVVVGAFLQGCVTPVAQAPVVAQTTLKDVSSSMTVLVEVR